MMIPITECQNNYHHLREFFFELAPEQLNSGFCWVHGTLKLRIKSVCLSVCLPSNPTTVAPSALQEDAVQRARQSTCCQRYFPFYTTIVFISDSTVNNVNRIEISCTLTFLCLCLAISFSALFKFCFMHKLTFFKTNFCKTEYLWFIATLSSTYSFSAYYHVWGVGVTNNCGF
jgi:hypothetical protein